MTSRSARSQMQYTLGFLFLLICTFAAFFTGVKVGADKMEAKYQYLTPTGAAEEYSDSYRQQDLVTFYHNVFLPYREFKREWDAGLDRLSRGENADENGALLKNLSLLADKQYQKITQNSIFAASPLLQESQLNILKSMTLFIQATGDIGSHASGEDAVKEVKENQYVDGAVRYGLLAQKNYYDAMMKWGYRNSDTIPEATAVTKTISFVAWKKMPLMQKNASIAELMLKRELFVGYDPQDVTAKVDNLIYSGNASQLGLSDVQASLTLLTSTEAVKEQDFLKWREQYYPKEMLPQLPFFYE